MYSKILIPMALNHGIGPTALEVARKLLAEGGEILAVHVHEMPSRAALALLEEKDVQALTDAAAERLRERVAGQPDVHPVLLHGHASRSIIDYADETGVDCIVMGSHAPGLTDFFLGSTTAHVVRHAPCAVHVIRSGA